LCFPSNPVLGTSAALFILHPSSFPSVSTEPAPDIDCIRLPAIQIKITFFGNRSVTTGRSAGLRPGAVQMGATRRVGDRRSGGLWQGAPAVTDRLHSSLLSAFFPDEPIHRHWPVRVKAAQKYGFEYSFDRSKDNCASRHAFARGSPERQRPMNSVINRLVALSLTFQ
jgi:hypothetical protein